MRAVTCSWINSINYLSFPRYCLHSFMIPHHKEEGFTDTVRFFISDYSLRSQQGRLPLRLSPCYRTYLRMHECILRVFPASLAWRAVLEYTFNYLSSVPTPLGKRFSRTLAVFIGFCFFSNFSQCGLSFSLWICSFPIGFLRRLLRPPQSSLSVLRTLLTSCMIFRIIFYTSRLSHQEDHTRSPTVTIQTVFYYLDITTHNVHILQHSSFLHVLAG